MSGPSRQAINASYHPQGYGVSPSLQRARRPFRVGNAVIGSSIALFALGVYAYSISSVKQDDFSDVADLLPPASERGNLRTLEDEARDKAALGNAKTNAFQSIVSALPSRQIIASEEQEAERLYQPSSPSGLSKAVPVPPLSQVAPSSPATASGAEESIGRMKSWIPRRLDSMGWVQARGWVESSKGNVLVWGAPDVDKVGRVGDTSLGKGPRLV